MGTGVVDSDAATSRLHWTLRTRTAISPQNQARRLPGRQPTTRHPTGWTTVASNHADPTHALLSGASARLERQRRRGSPPATAQPRDHDDRIEHGTVGGGGGGTSSSGRRRTYALGASRTTVSHDRRGPSGRGGSTGFADRPGGLQFNDSPKVRCRTRHDRRNGAEPWYPLVLDDPRRVRTAACGELSSRCRATAGLHRPLM